MIRLVDFGIHEDSILWRDDTTGDIYEANMSKDSQLKLIYREKNIIKESVNAIFQIDNQLYFLPANDHNILRYDIVTNQSTQINIPNATCEYYGSSCYFEHKFYLFSGIGKRVISYDCETNKVEAEIVGEEELYAVGEARIINNIIYVVKMDTNIIYKIDVIKQNLKTIAAEGSSRLVAGLGRWKNDLLAVDYGKREVIVFDSQDGKVKKSITLPKDYRVENYRPVKFCECEQGVFLFSSVENDIYFIDIEKGTTVRKFSDEGRQRVCAAKIEKEKLWYFSETNQKISILNLLTGTAEEYKIAYNEEQKEDMYQRIFHKEEAIEENIGCANLKNLFRYLTEKES